MWGNASSHSGSWIRFAWLSYPPAGFSFIFTLTDPPEVSHVTPYKEIPPKKYPQKTFTLCKIRQDQRKESENK